MKSILSLAAAAIIVMAAPAFATQGHDDHGYPGGSTGGNTSVTNSNSNSNRNWNSNTNVNANQNTNRNIQGQGQGQTQGQSNSQSMTGGNQNYSVSNYANSDPWANPASSAVAPSVYVTSICQTGASGAVQLPMFGFSFGITSGKEFCIAMMQANQYASDPQMRRYFECTSSDIRAAYKAVGRPCPQDGGAPLYSAATAPKTASSVAAVKPVYQRCTATIVDHCVSD